MTRVLLTTTSFQDTPGIHHDMLAKAGLEIVRERGPLTEARMLELVGQFDAYLCGDDAMTRAVIAEVAAPAQGHLQIRHRLDKIDVKAAPNSRCPCSSRPASTTPPSPSTPSASCSPLVSNLVVEANPRRRRPLEAHDRPRSFSARPSASSASAASARKSPSAPAPSA